tara:strand:+ start:6241 stop:6954 length:714 start_codon:yes stop_codon:yes gene_type:complete
MPVVNTDSGDGWISSNAQSSWAAARDITSGGTPDTNDLQFNGATTAIKSGSRGGGSNYYVTRTFMYFDTSGITGTVASATIKVRGYQQNGGSVIAVKSTAFGGDGGTALASGDIDAIVGWTTGASAAGNVTDYSSQITSGWSISAYNDLASTSDLRADMKNNDAVIICFMNYTYDYLNVEPSNYHRIGFQFTNNVASRPYIDYTLAGYGNDVIGVSSANIDGVIGVATANIDKIIGV